MKNQYITLSTLFISLTSSLLSTTAFAQSQANIDALLTIPEIRQSSEAFSDAEADEHPMVRQILDSQGAQYLHELDPKMTYSLDMETNAISVSSNPGFLLAEEAELAAAAEPFFGLGFFPSTLKSAGLYVVGQAATAITCFKPAKTVNVSAIQSSLISRDPPFGVGRKIGTPTDITGFTIGTRVDTETLKASGGAKNPSNNTLLESLHTGSCGGQFKMTTKRKRWPKKWASLNIDDTGSMNAEIGGVKSALASFIDAQGEPDEGDDKFVSYSLVTFKDSPQLVLSRTEDGGAAKSAVNSISASGGGDCPEDSLGALNLSLNQITSGTDEDTSGEIVLVTDASPQSGDIDGFISNAQSQGVAVNVLLSGDCTSSSAAVAASASLAAEILSSRDVFSKIARETGGLYVYEPNGTEEDYARLLDLIFSDVIGEGIDTEAPIVSVSLSQETIWPPNHNMVLILPTVSALDNQDLNPVIELISVTSSEPDNGQGDGNTEDDIEIAEDGSIYVRAERSGTSEMRIYTVSYKATDASGNEGFGSADVVVLHNQ